MVDIFAQSCQDLNDNTIFQSIFRNGGAVILYETQFFGFIEIFKQHELVYSVF